MRDLLVWLFPISVIAYVCRSILMEEIRELPLRIARRKHKDDRETLESVLADLQAKTTLARYVSLILIVELKPRIFRASVEVSSKKVSKIGLIARVLVKLSALSSAAFLAGIVVPKFIELIVFSELHLQGEPSPLVIIALVGFSGLSIVAASILTIRIVLRNRAARKKAK